jgi:hypothetical protein
VPLPTDSDVLADSVTAAPGSAVAIRSTVNGSSSAGTAFTGSM